MSWSPCRFVRGLPAFLLLLLALPAAAQQTPPGAARPEVLRGRVVADSGGVAISGADVVVTMPPDRATAVARTDSAGRFELRLPNGSGDYLVHVNLLGWAPWRKRVTRVGGDSVLTVDVRLTAKAVALPALSVTPERRKPDKRENLTTGAGGGQEVVAGVNAAVSPTGQGDLAAMAATIPGVNAVPGGISVLGLPPAQNQATLNGMAFGSGDVPRDARTWTRVSTSSFDPARGGFSGAQLSVDLLPGSIFGGRRAHLTLDAPQLQYTDRVAARLGQRFTNLQASAGGDGELVRDRYYYNLSAQGSRRIEDATSLLNAGDDALRAAGVMQDSAARFLQILSAAGVPVTAGADSRLTTTGSFIGRIDHTPSGTRSWAVTAYGKYSGADAALSPLVTPGHGGTNRSGVGMLQAEHSLYFYRNYLNLARSALTFASDRARPAMRLPDGRVLVSSPAETAGPGAVESLAFGGNPALDSRARSWTWETTDELQFYNRDSRHKLKLFANSRLDGYDRSPAANLLGSYGYNSLADLAANRPASYSRVLSAPDARGGEWNGVLALGDTWRPTRKLSLLLGARAEGNRYTAAPALNPAVLSTFGARTDAVPDRVHLSPRLGFSFNPSAAERSGIASNGAVTRILGPRGIIRGGIGEFRGLLPPALLSEALVSTGLPGASRRLLCVGPAVAAPDWRALAAGGEPPSTCADGSGAFADAAPAVRLFHPSYDAAHSWRANLGWSGTLLGFGLTVDGIYSLNLGQPGLVDLNFSGTPRFTLGDEGRPVYVSPSAIVPSTGAVSPLEARRSGAFGRVLQQRSDLRGYSRQVTAALSPGLMGISRWYTTLAYTLAQSHMQTRGFDGAAFGDPALRESAPGDFDIRHQLQLQVGYGGKLNFSAFGILSSPRPFTPIIGGDVNGDGVAGDRAFVFDPAGAGDPALAAGMRSLLATSSSRVRDCLQRQLGRAAGRNSCRGAWTADLRAQVSTPQRFAVPGPRVSATLDLSNILGGVDQLLHGSTRLHGWGAPAIPDPVLYQVRGFDPGTGRFRYEVNPRFGDTRPAATTFRAPFRVTLDISLNLGKPIGQQQLERSLTPHHRMTAAALKTMYARNVLDVYRSVLEESDSLLLTAEQTKTLKDAQAKYRARMDSLWLNLAEYLVGLPEHYDGTAALKRQEDTIDEAWEITRLESLKLKEMLTPLQVRLAPDFVRNIMGAKPPLKIRMFMSGP